jgi:hypothetical protein
MDKPTTPTWSPRHAEPEVVTLTPQPDRTRLVGTTRVVLESEQNPFERLSPDARKRLLVRVLCSLVAYDASEPEVTDRLAG